MGCCHSRKGGKEEQESLRNTIAGTRDPRLDITNTKVMHKVTSIVKPSVRSKERDVLSVKGTKDYHSHQPELPLTAPQIAVEF